MGIVKLDEVQILDAEHNEVMEKESNMGAKCLMVIETRNGCHVFQAPNERARNIWMGKIWDMIKARERALDVLEDGFAPSTGVYALRL